MTEAPEIGSELHRRSDRFGTVLACWIGLTIACHAALWVSGIREYEIREAIEEGAGRIEDRMRGDESEDAVRRAIETQRESLPFWVSVTRIRDFIIAPLLLVLRPLLVATVFSALAALRSRPGQFALAMSENARWQGIWVLGTLTRTTLALFQGSTRQAATSAVLLIPPGRYDAQVWLSLQYLDAFAAVGWVTMGYLVIRRGQAGIILTPLVCIFLFWMECTIRVSGALVLELSMRSALTGQ